LCGAALLILNVMFPSPDMVRTASDTYRVVTCLGTFHAEISLELLPSTQGYGFEVGPDVPAAYRDSRYLDSIRRGIKDALQGTDPSHVDGRVRLVNARDLSGETAPAAFQACAHKAMLKLLQQEGDVSSS
jgi:hypothetical protein